MSLQMVLLPVFALVLLVFILMFAMARSRFAAIGAKEVRVSQIALGQNAWPEQPTKIANAYGNQFELPVLFFALVAIALPLRKMDLVMVCLAWVFVITRYAHAFIYATSNRINHRFMAFFAGALVLMGMWLYFAIDILTAAARA